LCDSKEFEVFSSIIRMLILPIIERIVLHYSLACVNMSKILYFTNHIRKTSGE